MNLDTLAKELVGVQVEGRGCPPDGITMIGLPRLENIRYCCEDVIANNVPGDFIETGVWKGGATVFMRAILKRYVSDRKVWVADSFCGITAPEEKYPADKGATMHEWNDIKISLEEVKKNFERYGMLDEQVVFLKGWFKDTLPTIDADQKFSVIRLDGDMYSSTIQALENLYPKLSIGGYCIIDDYSISNCAKAVADYREQNGITEPIETVDWTGVYWKKTK